ncbi:MFS transporter [Nonomuraea sp. NN258]|uniref:MFS transporter n=1 Tax=Nonomuraea antri TaxID=2730852 RepID=UPI001569FB39|nr:MFS transporter [Nonomuraea antri]NRQ35140.1 MFS transporter [Nonomuraea antri]
MSTVAARVRLVRDRPTWLIYLQLGVFATYLYGLSAALPLLRADQQTSATVAGLHGSAMAVGSIVAGLSLPLLTRRFGRRAASWVGVAGTNAGVLMIAATSALPLTLLGYFLGSTFGCLMLYAGMAALSDHHGPAGPAAISEANAVGVVVGMGVTFALSEVAQSALGWRAALLITPLVSVLLALTMGRVWAPDTVATDGGAAGERPVAPLGWRFHVAGFVLFCCVALEFCFNLWAAELFSVSTGLSPETAATALTAFVAGMALGRFGGAQLALRLPPVPLFAGALAVTAAGWLVFWASAQPVLSYAGLVLSGLGVALHFPLALAALIDHSGARTDRAAAASPIWGGAAMAAGPLLLGALADGFGTRTAFVLVPVLVCLAVGGLLTSSRRT